MSGLIAAGITAASGLIGSAINAGMQARTNAMNKQQADEAYRRQLEAIKEQNIYNSPSMQVARMKAAGLNPSLAYGADGALTGEQTDIPAYSPIPSESPNVGNLGNVAASAIQAGIDVREQENRNNLAVAEITVKDSQTFAYLMQGHLSRAQVEETLSLLGYKISEIESRVRKNYSDIEMNDAEIERLSKLNEVSDEEKKEIQSRVRLNEQQIKTLASQYDLNEAQAYRILQMLPHEIALSDSQTAFNYVQSNEGNKRIEYIAQEIGDMSFYRELSSKKLDWEREKFVAELKVKRTEYYKDVGIHLMDNIGRISGFVVGASGMRSEGALNRDLQREIHGLGPYSPISNPIGFGR